MNWDKKGIFSKYEVDDDERFNLSITPPSLKTIKFRLISLILLLPWTVIFSRLKIFKKIFDFLELIMSKGEEEEETPKKMFYFTKLLKKEKKFYLNKNIFNILFYPF